MRKTTTCILIQNRLLVCPSHMPVLLEPILTCFRQLVRSMSERLSQQISKKSVQLDPIPFIFFFECLDHIIPILTKIVNTSLSSGSVPHVTNMRQSPFFLKRPVLTWKCSKPTALFPICPFSLRSQSALYYCTST